MEERITAISDWLASTQLSYVLGLRPEVIPLLQTIHIICVAAVFGSAAFVNLRMLGAFARRQPMAAIVDRFVPWIWWTLPVSLLTGLLMTIAEPARELQSPSFRLKMLALIGVILATLIIQHPLQKNAAYWEENGLRSALGKAIALISIALWLGIIVAGRMIAYDLPMPS